MLTFIGFELHNSVFLSILSNRTTIISGTLEIWWH